jgi:2-polyprenyl-3-methyl-5-hydroxy-6-metoxy-1,4-benzoquinol methylase
VTLPDRIFSSLTASFDLLAIYVGDRLGWYAALAEHGPSTAGELAAATETQARYAREWLEHQAVTGLLTVDTATAAPDERRYSLPPEHVEALLDRDSLNYSAPLARALTSSVAVMPQLLHAYRHGGGVPWSAYGTDGVEGQADSNRPLFQQLLVPEWLPAMPDVHERLGRAGARVADVACGGGWASIAIAQAYPDVRVDGFDLDEASIALARANAAAEGVADRVTFQVHDIAAGPAHGRYDVVCVLEALHDMARPVEALASMRAMAGDGGTVLVMDERTADRFAAPADEQERTLYGFSLFSCLPTALSETPSAGTGTVMRPDTLRRYARAAGFADAVVLDIEHDKFRLYRLV